MHEDKINAKFEYNLEQSNDYVESIGKMSELKIENDKNSEDIQSLLDIFPEYSESFLKVNHISLQSLTFLF